jgi:hypothetical protein
MNSDKPKNPFARKTPENPSKPVKQIKVFGNPFKQASDSHEGFNMREVMDNTIAPEPLEEERKASSAMRNQLFKSNAYPQPQQVDSEILDGSSKPSKRKMFEKAKGSKEGNTGNAAFMPQFINNPLAQVGLDMTQK